VEAAADGARLDKWLADPARLGSRSRATRALLHGRIWVDDREMTLADAARRVAAGEAVRIWTDRPGSAARQGPHRAGALDIVYEDDDLLVLAKPAGLLTVPMPARPDLESLAERVDRHWRSHRGRRARAVHRLDRDTTGLVVFAATARAQSALRDQFAARTPERVYLAVVLGWPQPPSGRWQTWLRWDATSQRQRPVGPRTSRAYEAISTYRVLERFDAAGAALVEVRLQTGKRHQVRVQAWLSGHALLGERTYTNPPGGAPAAEVAFARQALHGTRLGFVHPVSGARLAFDLPLPADMLELIARLRGGAARRRES
jgi:23S rRNA pseudouridine1911/1915/1917 synthase